jgi:sodium/bile acid cotransporter 7
VFILSIVLKAASNVGLQIQQGAAEFTWSMVALSGGLAVFLHLAALTGGFWSSRWLGLDRPRQIAVAISCSQKTLPVSLSLFLSYFKVAYPLAVVPLLFYHVGQLVLDTFIADRWLRGSDKGTGVR